MNRPLRCWLSAVVFLLAIAGCSDEIDYGGPAPSLGPTREQRVKVDDRPTQGSKRPPPAVTRPTGVARFVAVDRTTGRARAGVPIAYRKLPAGDERTVFTGHDGTLSVQLESGDYDARVVVGCAPAAVVHHGGRARFGVAARRSSRVELQTDSVFRFIASGPITWNAEPPWERNDTIAFSFRLVSHADCGGRDAANTSLGPLRVEASGPLEILRVPSRSDDEAMVTLRMRCRASGNPKLILYDRTDPSNTTDLLTFRAAFAPGDWCD